MKQTSEEKKLLKQNKFIHPKSNLHFPPTPVVVFSALKNNTGIFAVHIVRVVRFFTKPSLPFGPILHIFAKILAQTYFFPENPLEFPRLKW